MSDYTVTIITASKELTARERIAIKDFTNAISFDTELEHVDSLLITPKSYAVVHVVNPNSKNDKEYDKYIIMSADGTKYVTGSKTFWNAFCNIYEEMTAECPDEEFTIEVYKKPSNNYKGKFFISCSVI